MKGAVELVRDFLDEEDASGAVDHYLYVFDQSEVNKEEVSREAVIVKEDKPGKMKYKYQ